MRPAVHRLDPTPGHLGANDLIQTFVPPAVSATTDGVGNVPVSMAEDIPATILSILAIVIPVAVAALIVLLTGFVIWFLHRRARRPAEARGG